MTHQVAPLNCALRGEECLVLGMYLLNYTIFNKGNDTLIYIVKRVHAMGYNRLTTTVVASYQTALIISNSSSW